jgi:hypothetical protein
LEAGAGAANAHSFAGNLFDDVAGFADFASEFIAAIGKVDLLISVPFILSELVSRAERGEPDDALISHFHLLRLGRR